MTEPADSVVERSLPLGIWDLGFDLRHKIEFNFDTAKEKVMSEISEQQMVEFLLDTLLHGSAATFKIAYASNRGNMRVEVEHLKKQLEEAIAAHAGCVEKAAEAAKVIADGHLLVENMKRAGLELKNERDGLLRDMEATRKTIATLGDL